MMVPQVATMIPLFRMISKMKLLNTVWAFILPSISTPFLMQKALRVPSNKRTFDHTGAVHSYMQLYFIIFIISYYFHGERGILCQTSITANFQNRNFLKKTV